MENPSVNTCAYLTSVTHKVLSFQMPSTTGCSSNCIFDIFLKPSTIKNKTAHVRIT